MRDARGGRRRPGRCAAGLAWAWRCRRALLASAALLTVLQLMLATVPTSLPQMESPRATPARAGAAPTVTGPVTVTGRPNVTALHSAHEQRIAALERDAEAYALDLLAQAGEAVGPGTAARKVFRREHKRVSTERRQRAEQERWKAKINGQVRKLKVPRAIEEEEWQLFTTQHDHELKRAARFLGLHACNASEACGAALSALVYDSLAHARRDAPAMFVSRQDVLLNAKAALGGSASNASVVAELLPQEHTHLHHSSCAVVGNSGMLRRRLLGSAIDSHNAVLRINQAPVQGYEADVGSRTMLRLLNNVWAGNYVQHPLQAGLVADLQAGSTVVATRATPTHFKRLVEALRPARPDVRVLLLSVEMLGHAREFLEGYRLVREMQATVDSETLRYKGGSTPSTGFMALYLASVICPGSPVTVFGFSREASRDARSSKYSYHYFKNYADTEELRAHPHHSFQLEGDLIMTLNKLNVVQVCNGNSQVGDCMPVEAENSLKGEEGELFMLRPKQVSKAVGTTLDASEIDTIDDLEALDLENIDPNCLAKGSSNPCFKKALQKAREDRLDSRSNKP